MVFPAPQPGLVIAYAYLWAHEHRQGLEDGLKDRPCAIIATRQVIEGKEVVTVIPITHTPPATDTDAVELPAAIKNHLGLDDQRSWVVVTETNDFLWPGPDIRPISGSRSVRYAYGLLPPRFFNLLRDKILQAHLRRTLTSIPRTE